jgi:hypothetical protein
LHRFTILKNIMVCCHETWHHTGGGRQEEEAAQEGEMDVQSAQEMLAFGDL